MSTVPTNLSEQSFSGNGVTVDFPLSFPILEDADLDVYTYSTGVDPELQVLDVDYTVVGTDAPIVTMLVAPPVNTTLHVVRNVPITQLTDYLTAGRFSPASHTLTANKHAMIDQDLDRRLTAAEALLSVAGVTEYSARILTHAFTSHATEVVSGFPITYALPAGVVAAGVNVVKTENLDDPTALFEEAVCLHWEPSGENLLIRYISGLQPGVHYKLTYEVIS